MQKQAMSEESLRLVNGDEADEYKRNVPYDEPGYASCQVCW